jgi:hypothetical protein
MEVWSASRPGRFTPREIAPGKHRIGGWGGPQSRSGRSGEEKIPEPLPGLEPLIIQFVSQPYTTELSRLFLVQTNKMKSRHDLKMAMNVLHRQKKVMMITIRFCFVSQNIRMKIYRSMILPVVLYGYEI